MFDEAHIVAVIKASQTTENLKALRQDMMVELGLSGDSWTSLWTHICTLPQGAYKAYLEK